MSDLLVLDEWVWADFSGENQIKNQAECFQFLEAVFKKCDRILTVKGSSFAQKTFRHFKFSDTVRRKITVFYTAYFLHNSDKLVEIEETELQPLPEELAKEVKSEDQYIVQSFFAAKASIIITSDSPLLSVLEKNRIPCQLRDKYVPNYIAQHGRK